MFFSLFWLFQLSLGCGHSRELGQSSEGTQTLGDEHRANKKSPRGSGQDRSSIYHDGPQGFILGSPVKSKSFSWPSGLLRDAAQHVIQSSLSCFPCSAPAMLASPGAFRGTRHTRALGPGKLLVSLLGSFSVENGLTLCRPCPGRHLLQEIGSSF